jgi:hypothetical protein
LALLACDAPNVAITPRALPSLTPTEDPAPTRTPRPLPTASQTPAPVAYFVANTGRDGVVLRDAPGRGERVGTLTDGARVVPQGEEGDVGGRHWLRVQDASGWVASDFLVATPLATRSPTPRR